MRRILLMILICGIVVMNGRSEAADALANLDLVSAYVFRGVTYNDGPCLQPSLETSGSAILFAVWANVDLNDYGHTQAGDISEVDFTLAYHRAVGSIELSAGMMQFLFPEAGPDTNTRELFGTASRALGAGLNGSIYVGYDIDEIDDLYASGLISYAISMGSTNFEFSLAAGYAGERTSVGEKAGIHEYTATCKGTTPLANDVHLSGFLNFTGSLDREVLPDQAVEFFGGVAVSHSF